MEEFLHSSAYQVETDNTRASNSMGPANIWSNCGWKMRTRQFSALVDIERVTTPIYDQHSSHGNEQWTVELGVEVRKDPTCFLDILVAGLNTRLCNTQVD